MAMILNGIEYELRKHVSFDIFLALNMVKMQLYPCFHHDFSNSEQDRVMVVHSSEAWAKRYMPEDASTWGWEGGG